MPQSNMMITQPFATQNREHAALLLAEQLRRFKDSKTIVIGVSHGGALIGYHLARILHLPFDLVPCKKINHPADARKSIGSISVNEVIIHEDAHDIPREYIRRQIVLTQNALKAQFDFYRSSQMQQSVRDKTIIIVGDVSANVDDVLAALRAIRKRHPKKIIVALPATTPEVNSWLLREVNEIAVLEVEHHVQQENFYEEGSAVKDDYAKELIVKAITKFNYG